MNRRAFIKYLAFVPILLSVTSFGKAKKRILAGECTQCGFCCEHIPLPGLKKGGNEDENRFLSFMEPVDWHKDINEFYHNEAWKIYRCRHHDKDTGKCMIYETRPKICRDYPKDIRKTEHLIYKNCGYKIEWE